MCYTLVGILFAIGRAINNTYRAGIRRFAYRRPEHIYRIVLYVDSTRPAGVAYVIYLRLLTGYTLYVLHTRPCNVPLIIPYIRIINNSGAVYNVHYPGLGHIVIINIGPVNISLGCKGPVIIRHFITIAK